MQILNKETDRFDKILLLITYIIRLVLAIAIVTEILNQRWALLFTTSLIFILTFIPTIFEKRFKIDIPLEIEIIIIIFIYASLFLGEIKSFYTTYLWWDILLHISSGIVLGFFGFLILYVLYSQDKVHGSPIWIAVFSFCFAVAIGAIWEIFEFAVDNIFGFNMQKNGLNDTMWDLIVDSLGALITSTIGYYYLKDKKKGLFNRIILKFVKKNPKFFK